MAMSIMAASAFSASPQLFNKNGGTPLRDVNTKPKNQPDAGEFVNVGEVKLVTAAGTIACKEIEFGTTVVNNAGAGADVVVAVPFGVAEGDECAVGANLVPTYFDTTPTGAVGNAAGTIATVSINAAKTATVHNLSFSQNIPGAGFCKGDVNGKTGTVANGTEPFGEEGANGLTLTFTKTKVPISNPEAVGECALAGAEAELTAVFRLETPSTATEGWWLG
jgi:hypothetical protein